MNTPQDTSRTQTHQALWLSALLAAFGLVLSLIFWERVPDPMPIHWNARGEPDGFGSRTLGLCLMPALTLGLPLLISTLTRIDPRQRHVSRSSNALGVIIGGLAAFMFAIHGVIIRAAISPTMMLDSSLVILLVGALFIIIGNAMPKFGSNYFVGIRTPWTLQNEKVWIKTHRLAGKLFVAAGLCSMVLGFFFSASAMFPIFMGLTLTAAGVPVLYSWWIYKEESR